MIIKNNIDNNNNKVIAKMIIKAIKMIIIVTIVILILLMKLIKHFSKIICFSHFLSQNRVRFVKKYDEICAKI